jgi:1-acyl-sn-glycerol-3-phosphate acyltransferase
VKPFYKFAWIVVRTYLKLFCKLTIQGEDNIPLEGGVIIAANHISASDPPIVAVSIRRELYFLAKKELFKNPLLRMIIANLNAIPLTRGVLDQKALGTAETALRNGYGLIMFPEGTRSQTGDLKKGKPGVGLLARRIMVPVVPTYVENSRDFQWLFLTRKRLTITFGKAISREWIGSRPDDKVGYRAITEEIMIRIAALGQQKSGNYGEVEAYKRLQQP